MHRCVIGIHPTLDGDKVLAVLCDYVKTGTLPSPGMSAHIIAELSNTDPTLRDTHYILADELAKLPKENCPYTRDVYMRSVLERLCTKMSTVKHPSIEQMLPILQMKLKIVCQNIQGHNKIVTDLLKDLMRFLNSYVNEHSFNTEELLRVARGNSDLIAMSLRPVIQLSIDIITTALANECIIERLQLSINAIHQMIARMSGINHTVIGRIFSDFENFNCRQREAMVILTENLTNMLSNLGNCYVSYVTGRPFDTVFLDRIRAYLSSKSCPTSWRPVVETVIGTLQGPGCLQAMTCRECRHEHVVQTNKSVLNCIKIDLKF